MKRFSFFQRIVSAATVVFNIAEHFQIEGQILVGGDQTGVDRIDTCWVDRKTTPHEC